MPRPLNRLSARQVATLGPGLHADGGGLYLQVGAGGARSWIFRYRQDGRLRDMGLGPARDVPLRFRGSIDLVGQKGARLRARGPRRR
ncbi:MAG TPA: integrase, partial [Gammaproteobacteria bacterium]|nr:integrase [Gammaproteobacteria bacterium]MCH77852.1 integrase [Gammaproteobacteria bacterium]